MKLLMKKGLNIHFLRVFGNVTSYLGKMNELGAPVITHQERILYCVASTWSSQIMFCVNCSFSS